MIKPKVEMDCVMCASGDEINRRYKFIDTCCDFLALKCHCSVDESSSEQKFRKLDTVTFVL